MTQQPETVAQRRLAMGGETSVLEPPETRLRDRSVRMGGGETCCKMDYCTSAYCLANTSTDRMLGWGHTDSFCCPWRLPGVEMCPIWHLLIIGTDVLTPHAWTLDHFSTTI